MRRYFFTLMMALLAVMTAVADTFTGRVTSSTQPRASTRASERAPARRKDSKIPVSFFDITSSDDLIRLNRSLSYHAELQIIN
ncbi:MAG: hypothetical protein IJG42_10350 [Muribaculaceae bacterium]|nr:hypothetical protein [Muribaculaceae bacterium]